MNTVLNIILGIWSGIASFLSPVWLFMVILHLTGLIYQYGLYHGRGHSGYYGAYNAVFLGGACNDSLYWLFKEDANIWKESPSWEHHWNGNDGTVVHGDTNLKIYKVCLRFS